MQTVKRTVSKAKPNSEDHFFTKLSLNSQAEKNAILAAEKLFSHNLRKSLPSLIPSTKIGSTEKSTVTQNLRQKLSESSPGTTKRIWTDEKRLRHKKKIVVNQKDRPRSHPAGNYMFQVNNRNTRTSCEICPKLTIKVTERRQWHRSGIFIAKFEHISHLVLVFLLLTLSR